MIQLKPFESEHLAATLRWMNDPQLMRLLDRERPVTALEHENWYKGLHQNKTCLYFAIETTEAQHVGNVWLWNIDQRHRKAELRIVLDLKCAGQGYGSQAIQLLCQIAFERLNLHKIYAYVLQTNPRARRAFEKVGFVLEGTLKQDRWMDNRYVDVYLLGCVAAPTEPRE